MHNDAREEPMHDDKGYSEEQCVRCGWVMGHRPLNCNNDNTPHVFPSQLPKHWEGQTVFVPAPPINGDELVTT